MTSTGSPERTPLAPDADEGGVVSGDQGSSVEWRPPAAGGAEPASGVVSRYPTS